MLIYLLYIFISAQKAQTQTDELKPDLTKALCSPSVIRYSFAVGRINNEHIGEDALWQLIKHEMVQNNSVNTMAGEVTCCTKLDSLHTNTFNNQLAYLTFCVCLRHIKTCSASEEPIDR